MPPQEHDVTSCSGAAGGSGQNPARRALRPRHPFETCPRHAQEEAENANVQARDIENAIRTATAVIPQEGDRYRLEGGTDLDGGALTVVVREIQPGLFVITVF